MASVQSESRAVERLIRIGEVKRLTGLSTAPLSIGKSQQKSFRVRCSWARMHALGLFQRFRTGSLGVSRCEILMNMGPSSEASCWRRPFHTHWRRTTRP